MAPLRWPTATRQVTHSTRRGGRSSVRRPSRNHMWAFHDDIRPSDFQTAL
jgi:hypothetical protein